MADCKHIPRICHLSQQIVLGLAEFSSVDEMIADSTVHTGLIMASTAP